VRRRVLTALVAAALAVGAVASPVLAADPVPGRPLPEEPPVTRLATRATTALVADLDGDGTREVVAVTADNELPGLAAVQAWWVAADGSATASSQVRLRRSATFDDRVGIGNGIRIDEEGMTGVRISEPAHLFTVRREGREVVLVAGIGANPELTSPCCLTMWEVAASAPDEIELRLAAELHVLGRHLVVADLDADGTDEVLVVTDDDLALLRWDGTAYAVSRSPVPGGGCCPLILHAGDSDGVVGDDVLLIEQRVGGELVRLTLREGALVAERAAFEVERLDEVGARILELPGRSTIFTTDGAFARLWSWPRDGEMALVLSQPSSGLVPQAVLGSSQGTAVVIGGPDGRGSLQVLHAARGVWREIETDNRAAAFATVPVFNHEIPSGTPTGVVRGGLPDAPDAFTFDGMLLVPTGNPDDPISRKPMALLPGRSLAGTAGPDGSWVASLRSPERGSPVLFDPWVFGNLLATSLAGPLELAATRAVLEPEIESGELEPTFLGVAPDPVSPDGLMVGPDAVDAVIEAPPGSGVWWSGQPPGESLEVGPDGMARIRLLDSASSDTLEGSIRRRSLWLITPVGHAYHGTWQIRVYRQPPDLGIDAEVPILDFAPSVAGRTLPGSTLTVNGEPAAVASDGSFAVPIEVGIVPTSVRLVATDPVGNRSEHVVTRVWPLDYRQLPWVPIAVLVLVTVAGLLYRYEPDVRARRRPAQDEESTFEEIGG
jgi:hypothetical protein